MVRSRVKQAVRISSASKRAAELRAEVYLSWGDPMMVASPQPPASAPVRSTVNDNILEDILEHTNILDV